MNYYTEINFYKKLMIRIGKNMKSLDVKVAMVNWTNSGIDWVVSLLYAGEGA